MRIIKLQCRKRILTIKKIYLIMSGKIHITALNSWLKIEKYSNGMAKTLPWLPISKSKSTGPNQFQLIIKPGLQFLLLKLPNYHVFHSLETKALAEVTLVTS
jgi:hypothetical protein